MRYPLDPADEAYAIAVANNVRDEMKRQHMTQRALAYELGWNELRLARRVNPYVRQFTELTVVELARIADILGQPMSAFLPPPTRYVA